LGSKFLNKSTNQNPTTFSGGKPTNSPAMDVLIVAGVEGRRREAKRERRTPRL